MSVYLTSCFLCRCVPKKIQVICGLSVVRHIVMIPLIFCVPSGIRFYIFSRLTTIYIVSFYMQVKEAYFECGEIIYCGLSGVRSKMRGSYMLSWILLIMVSILLTWQVFLLCLSSYQCIRDCDLQLRWASLKLWCARFGSMDMAAASTCKICGMIKSCPLIF